MLPVGEKHTPIYIWYTPASLWSFPDRPRDNMTDAETICYQNTTKHLLKLRDISIYSWADIAGKLTIKKSLQQHVTKKKNLLHAILEEKTGKLSSGFNFKIQNSDTSSKTKYFIPLYILTFKYTISKKNTQYCIWQIGNKHNLTYEKNYLTQLQFVL